MMPLFTAFKKIPEKINTFCFFNRHRKLNFDNHEKKTIFAATNIKEGYYIINI